MRMMRALVKRAGEGDLEAVEQLQRIEQLAPLATGLGIKRAHDSFDYSYTTIAEFVGLSRQNVRQRAERVVVGAWFDRDAHQLVPGHTKRGCSACHAAGAVAVAGSPA